MNTSRFSSSFWSFRNSLGPHMVLSAGSDVQFFLLFSILKIYLTELDVWPSEQIWRNLELSVVEIATLADRRIFQVKI